jgi:uncharacterized protein YdcH (DUF465 family)
MDSRFLELWGHVLIQAAKNQEFLEKFSSDSWGAQDKCWDFAAWAETWYEHLPTFRSLFLESANMEQLAEIGFQSMQAWQQGLDGLYKQWQEFAELFGLVPKNTYDQLAREHEELKGRIKEQEKTIQRLNQLLEQKGLFDLDQMSDEFSRLLNAHNEQFEGLMRAIEHTWKSGTGSGDDTQG